MLDLSFTIPGVTHNDIHDLNIIVNYHDGKLQSLECNTEENGVKAKFGLIDFNDVAVSPYLFEVAMVIRDLMVDIEDVPHLEIGAYFLTGYTCRGIPNFCKGIAVIAVLYSDWSLPVHSGWRE